MGFRIELTLGSRNDVYRAVHRGINGICLVPTIFLKLLRVKVHPKLNWPATVLYPWYTWAEDDILVTDCFQFSSGLH